MKRTQNYDFARYIGINVEWKSNSLTKVGKILAINRSRKNIENNRVFKKLKIDFNNTRISQQYSQNDRFLIIVERFNYQGNPLLPLYYCTSVKVIAKSMGWDFANNTL